MVKFRHSVHNFSDYRSIIPCRRSPGQFTTASTTFVCVGAEDAEIVSELLD